MVRYASANTPYEIKVGLLSAHNTADDKGFAFD